MGGIIKKYSENKSTKKKNGFSLIELTVVMGIISILITLSAAALISARDRYLVDAAAENLLLTLREAQNNAISVKRIGSATPVAWAVVAEDNTSQISLRGYVRMANPNGEFLEELGASIINKDLGAPLIDLSYNNGGAPTSINDMEIAFTAPFGKSYLNTEQMIGPSGGSSGCTWTNEPEKPTYDYYITPTNCIESASIESNNDRNFVIALSYKGHEARIIINATGDARIE